MTDLITRLKKLSGPNPVVQVKLTADDAEAVERLVEDAERLAFLIKYGMGTWVDIPTDQPGVTHRITLYTRKEIDAARTPTKESA